MKKLVGVFAFLCSFLSVVSVQAQSITDQIPETPSVEELFEELSDADICVLEEIEYNPETQTTPTTAEITSVNDQITDYYEPYYPEGVFFYDFEYGIAQLATCSRTCEEEDKDWVIVSVCGKAVQISPDLYDLFLNEFPYYSVARYFGCLDNLALANIEVNTQITDEVTPQEEEPKISISTVGEACFVPEPEPTPEEEPVVEEESPEETPEETDTNTNPALTGALQSISGGAGCSLANVSNTGSLFFFCLSFLLPFFLVRKK